MARNKNDDDSFFAGFSYDGGSPFQGGVGALAMVAIFAAAAAGYYYYEPVKDYACAETTQLVDYCQQEIQKFPAFSLNQYLPH